MTIFDHEKLDVYQAAIDFNPDSPLESGGMRKKVDIQEKTSEHEGAYFCRM